MAILPMMATHSEPVLRHDISDQVLLLFLEIDEFDLDELMVIEGLH